MNEAAIPAKDLRQKTLALPSSPVLDMPGKKRDAVRANST